MEILILGGSGMLGHKLFQRLRLRHSDTYCTIRGSIHDSPLREVDLFQAGHIVENINVTDFPAIERLLWEHRPKFVINCVGIVKQRDEAKKAIPSIA